MNVSPKTDELRMVVTAFAGAGICFAPGNTVFIKAGIKVPQALLLNSEPISLEMRTPASTTWDQEALDRYEAASKPRQEPAPERKLAEPDILRMFGWTQNQFRVALATAGFPRSTEWREDPRAENPARAIWGEGITSHAIWRETAVQNWAAAVRSLGPI